MPTKTEQPTAQRAVLKTAVPGPKSRELRAREDEHLAPGLQGFALMAGIVVDHARGSAVTDVDGNTFLDIIGGIGVNGAVFSFADALVFHPLPVTRPSEVLNLSNTTPGNPFEGMSYPDYRDVRASSRSFTGIAAYRTAAWERWPSPES